MNEVYKLFLVILMEKGNDKFAILKNVSLRTEVHRRVTQAWFSFDLLDARFVAGSGKGNVDTISNLDTLHLVVQRRFFHNLYLLHR